jgi:methionine-rich copper-binding protein CopC
LQEAEAEQVELRLLTDPAFGEEFDTIVDEITDQYLKNELQSDERERVEKYFLSTADRQKKLQFASELLQRSEAERGKKPAPSLFEQFVAFWKSLSFAHVAMTAAAVIIVAGITFYLAGSNSTSFQALNLTISASDRAEGAAPARIKLPANTGLKLTLTIPESARGAKDYRARLIGENGAPRDLASDTRSEQTITVTVAAGLLTSGSYAIHLSSIKPDNTEERIRGSYFFEVE